VGILPPKRVTNVIIHHLTNSVSRDVTFHEQESYFVQTHFQGENSCKEDGSLLLPNLNLGLKVVVETGGDNVET
jgi:hypothetical protein